MTAELRQRLCSHFEHMYTNKEVRILKKFLSIFLILTILTTGFTTIYADSDVTGRLTGLGIMQGDEGGLRLEDNLTRAEFCTLVARLLQLGDYSAPSDTGFADVPQSHWASGCISALCSMQLVNGNGDGTFSPDNNIILPEAVKVLVCAVGYGVAVEGENPYPNGYLAMASKLGIISGITDDSNAITRQLPQSLSITPWTLFLSTGYTAPTATRQAPKISHSMSF